MDYALIKNGTVENVIVADAAFIDLIRGERDHIVLIEPGVGIGWGWNGAFVPPSGPEIVEN
jgi:hypothetical protein